MDRLTEINARLSAIAGEIEGASGDALTALETEVAGLTEERTNIQAEVEKRNQLRSAVAAGNVGTVIAPAVERTAAEIEAAEIRSFAEFIRGNATAMRSNTPQNFSVANNTSVIPVTISKKIIDAVSERCPILAGADVYHVRGTLKIPVYGKKADGDSNLHDITVSYGTEFSDPTADAGAFTSVDLTGYLLIALTLVSRSLINNADIDLVSFVVAKMADKIAAFVEQELLKGTGSANNHCTGALSTTNTMNAGSTSAISADNLIDLQAKVKQIYQANACWTMAPATFTAIKKLKDGSGKYLIQDDFSAGFPYRLLGKPVYLSDSMPAIGSANKAVLYGDYSGIAVNIREDISVEVLREAYATKHAVGILGYMEIDSKVQDNNKLAALVMSAG